MNEINSESNITIERIEKEFLMTYSNCKLLLMPSQGAEGFGRGIVEAGINSIPVLASNIGGMPEATCVNDFFISDSFNFIAWREALKKSLDPSIYAQNCQRALENSMAYEQRYLRSSFSEYIEKNFG